MREIKFRAWDNRRNTWTRFNPVVHGEYDFFNFSDIVLHYQRDLVIEQYSTKKDKAGTETYAGDIVKWLADDGTEQYPHKRWVHEVVEFKGAAFYPVCEMESQEFEIIGNIHENPELLK